MCRIPCSMLHDVCRPNWFKNDTVRLVWKWLRVSHHFTVPRTPWNKEGRERLYKSLLPVFRSITLELKFAHSDLPYFPTLVQTAINSFPSRKRDFLEPITVLVGMLDAPPIKKFYHSCLRSTVENKSFGNILLFVWKQLSNSTREHSFFVTVERFQHGAKTFLRWLLQRQFINLIKD